MRIVSRLNLEEKILHSIKGFPVTVLLGPRQCGKTTVAKKILKKSGAAYFDLENPEDFIEKQQIHTRLRNLQGLVVIDECQRQPALFPVLRVLADRKPLPARFLLLGSASFDLVRDVSESLAGRVAYISMGGFSIDELGANNTEQLWIRGRFPGSVLAPSEKKSYEWRTHFIQSFLERDIPQFGLRIPSHTLRRFWIMLSHLHAQIWNASDLARSMGTQETTARRYLDILSGAFMIRQLQPWLPSLKKRMIKSPKIYLRDSGLLHTLLSIDGLTDLESHAKLGASWEGFALESIIQKLSENHIPAYFWAVQSGAELDLFYCRHGKNYGVEIKYADTPRLTPSMRSSLESLKLEKLYVVTPVTEHFQLEKKVEAFSLLGFLEQLSGMK